MTGKPAPRKVLLIHVASLDEFVESHIFYPIKFALLSIFSHLRDAGVEVEVLDLENELGHPGSPEEYAAYLARAAQLLSVREFDIAAIGCYTSYVYTNAREIARLCRASHPRAFVVAGGYHPSSLPGDFDGPASPFDAVITGEAELALEDLAREGRPGGDGKFSVIAGRPLDISVGAALRLEEYPYAATPSPYYSVVLSRGCPFHCNYCVEPWAGGGWRPYSVAESLNLIDRVVSLHKPKRISIFDPLFGFQKAWRREFLEALVRRNYPVTYDMETRVDLLEREDVDLLARLDITGHLGVESASASTLRIMQKTTAPQRYLEQLESLLTYAARKDALFVVNMIFNHPGETPRTHRESLSFMAGLTSKLPRIAHRFNAFSYAFYPGAPQFYKISDFEEKYGTEVFHKEWWKGAGASGHQRAIDVVASREMRARFGRNHSYWIEDYKDLAGDAMEKASGKLQLQLASNQLAQTQAREHLPAASLAKASRS